jgi:hypothetical protein
MCKNEVMPEDRRSRLAGDTFVFQRRGDYSGLVPNDGRGVRAGLCGATEIECQFCNLFQLEICKRWCVQKRTHPTDPNCGSCTKS